MINIEVRNAELKVGTSLHTEQQSQICGIGVLETL